MILPWPRAPTRLHRDVAKLSAEDRELTEDFIRMLEAKRRRRAATHRTWLYRLKRAQQQAEQFIHDEGISSLPVDVVEIAESRSIVVQPSLSQQQVLRG